MNLAENLSLSAASTPDAPAVRLDDVVLSYAALDGASARVAGLLAAKGVGPGDRVGIMLPNVPQFLIVYYGILRLGVGRGPDERAAQGPRDGVLPEEPGRQDRVRVGRVRRACAQRRGRGGRGVHRGRARRLRADAGRRRAAGGGRRARRVRHRRDPLHLGHDGRAEGRRAQPPQPRAQLRGRDRAVRHRRRERHARLAAAVSQLRADLRDERHDSRRRLPDADPPLRSGQGAAGHRARRRQRVRGRADDVRCDPQPPERGQHRRLVAESVRMRRGVAAGRAGPARVPSRVRQGRPHARRARHRRPHLGLGQVLAGRRGAGDRGPPRIQGPRRLRRGARHPSRDRRPQDRARVHGAAGHEGVLRRRRRPADQHARAEGADDGRGDGRHRAGPQLQPAPAGRVLPRGQLGRRVLHAPVERAAGARGRRHGPDDERSRRRRRVRRRGRDGRDRLRVSPGDRQDADRVPDQPHDPLGFEVFPTTPSIPQSPTDGLRKAGITRPKKRKKTTRKKKTTAKKKGS